MGGDVGIGRSVFGDIDPPFLRHGPEEDGGKRTARWIYKRWKSKCRAASDSFLFDYETVCAFLKDCRKQLNSEL